MPGDLAPEALMRQTDWLNQLTRQLVSDPDRAEDVAQDVWLAALDQRGRITRLRPWLSRVARNVAARIGGRESERTEREARAARAEAQPSTVDMIARVQAQHRVVAAVLSLPEPYRTTVIMRFFENRAPRHISQQMSVPVETVRTRLRRALEQLRGRLDREFGDRHAWVAALTPLKAAALTTSLTTLGIVVKTKIIGVAVGLLLFSGLAWYALSGDPGPTPGTPPPTPRETAATAPMTGDAGSPVASDRSDAATRSDSERTPVAAAPETTAIIRGVFRAPLGAWPGHGTAALHPAPMQIEGGLLGLLTAAGEGADQPDSEEMLRVWAGQTEPLQLAAVDPFGSFSLRDVEPGEYRLDLRHPYLRRIESVPVQVEAGQIVDLGTIDAQVGASALVLVSDADGMPLPDAKVLLSQRLDMSNFATPGPDLSAVVGDLIPVKTNTDQRGAAQFEGLEGDLAYVLEVEAEGHVRDSREVVLISGQENLIQIGLTRGTTIEVEVVGDAGQPMPEARLSLRFPDILKSGLNISNNGAQRQEAPLDYTLTSEADGIARQTGIPAGRAELVSSTPGFLQPVEELSIASEGLLRVRYQMSRGATIAGRVVDESGAPIPGARVMRLQLPEQALGMDIVEMVGLDLLTSDIDEEGVACAEDGSFVLGGLGDEDAVTLAAAASGFDPRRLENLRAGQTDVELELPRAAVVTGTVLTEPGGEPVTNFEVRMDKRAFVAIERPVRRQSFRSADGSFTLAGVPRTRLRAVITAPGRAESSATVDLTDGDADLGEIRLLRPARITGITRGPDGQALSGVSVRVSRGPGSADSAMLAELMGARSARSDERGSFELDGLAGTAVRLVADKPGYAPHRSKAIRIAAGETVADVILQLGAGGEIQGRVENTDGAALSDWLVQVKDGGGTSIGNRQTDWDGRFSFEGLAPGNYSVEAVASELVDLNIRVQPGGRASGQRDVASMMDEVMKMMTGDRVVVREGEVSELVLVFEGDASTGFLGTEVTGAVRIGGESLQDGLLTLVETGATQQRHAAEVRAGRFRITGVQPGTYRAQVRAGLLGGLIGTPVLIKIPAATEFTHDLEFPGGELRGRAVDEQGRPAAGVMILLESAERGSDPGPRAVLDGGFAMTDGEGNFRFTGLAAGQYGIFGRELALGNTAGRSGRVANIELTAGETRRDLELEIDDGGVLDVDVRDDNGPRAGAVVTLLGNSGTPLGLVGRTLTDTNGRAELRQLPPGAYRVQVVGPPGVAGAVSDPVTLIGTESIPVRLHLRPGIPVDLKPVEGILETLGGELVLFSIWADDGALVRSGRVMVPRENPQTSSLALGRFLPGGYRARIESARLGVLEKRMQVPAQGRGAVEVTHGDLR